MYVCISRCVKKLVSQKNQPRKSEGDAEAGKRKTISLYNGMQPPQLYAEEQMLEVAMPYVTLFGEGVHIYAPISVFFSQKWNTG